MMTAFHFLGGAVMLIIGCTLHVLITERKVKR